MKKTPLKRKTPLKAKTTLKTKTPLKANSSLKAKTTLKNKQKTAKKIKGQQYWSIFGSLDVCHITGATQGIVPHHIFNGSNKELSERYGFILPLRSDWHTSTDYAIHSDRNLDLKYKKYCEEYFLIHYGTEAEFIGLFGKSWLEKAS